MSKLITHIKRLALALCFVTPLVSWAAAEKTNPVTEETETYENVFNGETEEWNVASNWDTETTPFITTTYTPALVVGKTVSTSTAIDGWTLRVGAYEGANISWNGGITKIQAGSDGCWLTVDETSSITIASFAGNQLEGSESAPFKLTSAKAGGITWLSGLTSAGNTTLPFWYYLKGEGTVVYGGDIKVANAQVIKQADVAISGTSQVASKMLVGFDTGTTKTFTADAAIKIKNGDNVLKTVYLTSVSANDDTTLTTEDAVGTCELVQKYDGVYLYWVDGDPADVPVAEKTYKPSININFTTGAANGLTTGADVGLSGYEVPGTSWNNYVVGNSTFSAVNAIDSTGAASAMSGVSVTISGTRGSYSCSSLTPSSNPLHGYIDENDGNPAPTVTVTGIPYYKYRVLVYHSTDTANAQFNYDTINGANYTYVENVLSYGTTAWGNAGAADNANAIAEGGNVLVTEALSGSTLTVVGHRSSGSVRGCIAAIQIIEVKADVGENDLEIAVDGEKEYTVTAEDAEKTGTVYLTGSGTLTLAGENKISAATINVGDLVTLVVDADRLDGTTFTGGGTVVYDTTAPVEGKGWTDSDWSGTVWIKNQAVAKFDGTKYGNAGSTIRFTGVTGYMETLTNNNTGKSTSCEQTVPFELVDDGDTLAFTYNNGWGGNLVKINTLKGTGTLKTQTAGLGEHIYIVDASDFTGVFNLIGKYVYVGGEQPEGTLSQTNPNGKLEIRSGVTMTVPAEKTWTANGGFVVNGTLNVGGTLASSHSTKAVSGAGTVVFTGRAPTVSDDAWWKNADWTGTVQIGGITDLVGTSDWGSGTYLDFNSYGNANSVIKLGNITGWLAGDTCNVPVNLAGTLTINNGFSGTAFTFKKLISNGGYITATDQAATARIVIEDGSEYAGYIGLNAKMVVFGTDNPTFVKGQVYVSSDAKITVPAVNTAYWAVGNIVVAGELKADSLARFGGGTHINTTGDGVFTLTSTGNGSENETNTDYARISGTGGSLKYEGTGWRALSTNNFPTAVTLVNEQAGDILLSRALTYTVGSLAGSKNFQGNYGSGSRYLNVIQSKDTEWSGKVVNDNSSRFAGLKLDASSTGTLTLSGTATQNVALEVNGGAVNLTGTWKGATTVAGTIGGTGTLTGDLTFSEGSTLKAYETGDADGLVVSGTVTCPEAKVTVDVSAIEPETDVALLKANGLDADNFALAEGTPEGYTLDVVEGVLTLVVPQTKVTVTVPAVPNTTVTVVVGEETIGTAAGNYDVDPDSVVTVTYAAAEGYQISGKTVYTIDTATETTFEIDESTKVEQIVAQIRTGATTYEYYTTLAGALASPNVAYGITLRANIDEDEVTISSPVMITGNYTINSDIKVVDGGQLQLMLVTMAGTLTIEENGIYATGGGTLSELVTKDGAKIQLTTLSDTAAPLSVNTLSVEGELTIISSWGSAVRDTYYKALSYVTANADIAEGATVDSVNEWSAKVEEEGDNTVVYLAITKVATVDGVYYDDAQDAVDAAVASGNPVEFIISDPGTVTLGAGETLSVKGVNIPTVELEDGLTTPPYSIENSGYDSVTGLTTFTVVMEATIVPQETIEINYNTQTSVSVIGYPEGSTFGWTVTGPIKIASGKKTDTLVFYSEGMNAGAATATVAVTNNEVEVATLTANITVRDVAAVIGETEYTKANLAQAVAAAVSSGEVLGLYAQIPDTILANDATLRVRVLANKNAYTIGQAWKRLSAYGTAENVYTVNHSQDGDVVTCWFEAAGEPSVMYTSTNGETVDYYTPDFKVNGDGTYKLLKDISRTALTVSKEDVILDLNGFTFTSTATSDAILVQNVIGASLTVRDTSVAGTGKIVANKQYAVNITQKGTLTIESGELVGSVGAVCAGNPQIGTIVVAISGGQFSCSAEDKSFVLNCLDDNRGTITVTGGTFIGFDPANTSDGNMVPVGYKSTETSTGVWTVAKAQGLDPASEDPSVESDAENEEDAVTDAKENIVAPTGVDKAVYAEYFKYDVAGDSGAYTVTIVGFADEVVENTDDDALDALQAAVDSEATEFTVEVPAGLYYKIETFDTLGSTPVDSATGLSNGTTEAVDKPTDTTQGFIKVQLSTKAFN